jgi:hypothetical protein
MPQVNSRQSTFWNIFVKFAQACGLYLWFKMSLKILFGRSLVFPCLANQFKLRCQLFHLPVEDGLYFHKRLLRYLFAKDLIKPAYNLGIGYHLSCMTFHRWLEFGYRVRHRFLPILYLLERCKEANFLLHLFKPSHFRFVFSQVSHCCL